MSSKPNIPIKSSGDTFSAEELNAIVDFFAEKPDTDEIPEAIDGKSAYDIAVDNGFVGTEQEWLDSLSPVRYMDGDIFEGDGETPETKTTIKDGSIEEEKLSEEVRGKLNADSGGVQSPGLVASSIGRFKKKLSLSPDETTIAFVGDSTSDFEAGLATYIPDHFRQHTVKGGLLEGFDVDNNLLNFGTNGNSLANFINNSPSNKGIDALILEAPDLVVFCYGINDVRIGTTSKDELKEMVIIAIEKIRDESPYSDILLRMPNSFSTISPNGWILQSDYSSVAEAAQAYSEILYDSYKELENNYDNVVLFNTQELITGREAKENNPALSDEIHPYYELIVDKIAEEIGYVHHLAYDKYKGEGAIIANYTQPWLFYPRVFENSDYFTEVLTGTLIAQAGTYIDIDTDTFNTYAKIGSGDVLKMGDLIFQIPSEFQLNPVNASFLRIFGISVPSNNASDGDVVKIYKHKYSYLQSAERYLKDKFGFPYAHRITFDTGGNGFLILGASVPDDGIITEKGKRSLSAFLDVRNGDVIVTEGIAPFTIENAEFVVHGALQLRINISGKDFSGYTGKPFGFVFGNHESEGPVPKIHTVTRDAVSWYQGDEIFNLTLAKKQFYNGTAWETLTSSV